MDLFGCVIFGCLGWDEQIRGSMQMRYFGLFGLCWTNSWIYSDACFWVVSVMLNKFVDLFGCVILGCLGSVEQIRGSIRIRYFGLFRLCWTNSWIYWDTLFWVPWVVLNKFVDLFGWVILGCLGYIKQIRGSIRMRYFGLFRFCWTNSWFYPDALFWLVSVILNKFVDLFGCIILGCLGCAEQIRRSIRMRYFGVFGLCWTNLWIYSDALFWVVWLLLNKFVVLYGCVILGCLGYVEQIRGFIRMHYFILFGLCWTNSRFYTDALFWVAWIMLNKFVDLSECVIFGCLGCVEQIRGSIRMRYFGLFRLSWTNSWIYSDWLFWFVWVQLNKFVDLFGFFFLGSLGFVGQIGGSIRMRHFEFLGLFGLCWTNCWISSDGLFWVVWVLLHKFVDLFGCVILGSLGFVGQIRWSIGMRCFGLFRLSWTISWIYSDGLFSFVCVQLNKFLDLFRCVISGSLGFVGEIRGSIQMGYFRLFRLCWTNSWIYSDGVFWVVWVQLNKFVDLFWRVILGSLGFVGQIRGSIRMRYFELFRLCWTNSLIYSDGVFWVVWVQLNKFVDLFGCVISSSLCFVGQIGESIRMRHFGFFGLFGFCWTNWWIYSDGLFWVVWVLLDKFVDLFGYVILGCLSSVEQIRGSIWMRYFGFFGFSWTNLWIYSDTLFWVLWVFLDRFVDLFGCLILGCFGWVQQIRGSIRMGDFGLFGFSWTNSWTYSDALFWVLWVSLDRFVDLFGWVILGCFGCVEQIRGSIRMGYLGLFGFSWTNLWISSDALFWVLWVSLDRLVDLFECANLGCLNCSGCVEEIAGSIRMSYFGFLGFCWANSWIYSDALFWVVWDVFNKFVDVFWCIILGSLDYVEQIRGSFQMRYFVLFVFSWRNSWIYLDALFWVIWVVLNKFVDLFQCTILGCFGCLGCVEQIRRSIRMGYFGLFGFSWTNLWIYSDPLFWVLWGSLDRFVDLFGCLILGCFRCVEEIRESILMHSFGFFGLCWTNSWIYADALFWVVWVELNKFMDRLGCVILGVLGCV